MARIFPFRSQEERTLDSFVTRNGESAIILRPEGGATNEGRVSRFGGLPLLSSRMEWPRDPAGRPLHFLAEIDCVELPWHGMLPNRGTISFFGRDDEEQIWEDNVDVPTMNCAVVYDDADPAARSLRDPPGDLAAIGNGLREAAGSEKLWSGNELKLHGRKVHIHRPLAFHAKPIMTIPESIYDGKRPIADLGTDLLFRALRDGKTSAARRQLDREGRLTDAYAKRRHAYLRDVASEVFAKDATSHEAHGDYSQMLGHPNTSQGTYPPILDAVCLLNIASDVAAGMTFGDCGFCTFWISEGDLSRRDFTRVHGQIAGA